MRIEWPLQRPHFAYVTAVTDGDTFRADIDLDLHMGYWNFPVRLNRCNAWERSTEAGIAARDNLRALLPVGRRLVLATIRDYKYGGEFVAEVFYFVDEEAEPVNLIDELIAQQWLAPWDGQGSAPLPPWPRTV